MIDPTGGLSDLDAKMIRMSSAQSLVEDPLRILRAFRFASQLDFRIDPETRRAIEEYRESLESVAAERVANELLLLLGADGSWRSIKGMADSRILQSVFPVLQEMDELLPGIRLLEHSIISLRELERIVEGRGESVFDRLKPELEEYFESERKKPLLKLAALLHDIGKPRTLSRTAEDGGVHFYGHDTVGEELLRGFLKDRLRMSKRDVNIVACLVRHHMRPHLLAGEPDLTERAIRRFLRDLGEEWLGVLLLAVVDALATDNGDTVKLQDLVTEVTRFRAEEAKKRHLERLITGDDLIEEFNLTPGPPFKEILDEIEEEQAEGRIRTREEALDFVREMLRRREE